MCSIVDANVAHEVFGSNRPPAGERFFRWVRAEPGRLVVGGQLLRELNKTSARVWIQQAILAGRVRKEASSAVAKKERRLRKRGGYTSNDPHVIALALLSGARLLYSNDKALQSDFTDRSLISSPVGRVYSTLCTKRFSQTHRGLLRRGDLCAKG